VAKRKVKGEIPRVIRGRPGPNDAKPKDTETDPPFFLTRSRETAIRLGVGEISAHIWKGRPQQKALGNGGKSIGAYRTKSGGKKEGKSAPNLLTATPLKKEEGMSWADLVGIELGKGWDGEQRIEPLGLSLGGLRPIIGLKKRGGPRGFDCSTLH